MKKYIKKVIGWLGPEKDCSGAKPEKIVLPVAGYITRIIDELLQAGYETYIVGGAIRDLLLEREPKDYDIATAATPEEVRSVFGRRQARIIGKRFRLVHLHAGNGEIVEISTFRRKPDAPGVCPGPMKQRKQVPDKLIFEDNEFGTAVEDAERRDFTVNALFYNPMTEELFDFTGQGMADIKAGVVRVIGNPEHRFEEDPVRLLRALKLVGQYGFTLEPATHRAVVSLAALLRHAAPSRLTLELEKILKSVWSDRILAAFHEYGLLEHFMYYLAERWGTAEMDYAMRLLAMRNERVAKGLYRASISIAMAALVLPFLELKLGSPVGGLWRAGDVEEELLEDTVREVLKPHCMIKRLNASCERILSWQPLLKAGRRRDRRGSSHNFAHAFEFMKIQNEVEWHSDELTALWKSGGSEEEGEPKRKRKRRKRRKPENPAADSPETPAAEEFSIHEMEPPAPLELGL